MTSSTLVYIVHSEWTESAGGGYSIIHGAFRNKKDAEKEAAETKIAYESLGNRCFIPSTFKEEGDENLDWDFDVHISEEPIK